MENASKALLIAGAILIVIALISVGVLIVSRMSGVTDILNNDSTAVAVGQVKEAAAKAFGAEIVNGRISLPGVVSRKKQIVPVLTEGLQ